MTLWFLKGLKSSLICTGGVRFGRRVPKKGFGGPCGDAASAGLPFGEDVDDVPFGFGEPP